MKKTFSLQVPGNADERVVESVKFEVRKYLKRERRKAIPTGFDQWDFACKIGADETLAEAQPVKEIFTAIDAVAKLGGQKIYVEVLAAPGKRFPAASILPPDVAAPDQAPQPAQE